MSRNRFHFQEAGCKRILNLSLHPIFCSKLLKTSDLRKIGKLSGKIFLFMTSNKKSAA
ncbi:Hypothetical protein BIBO2_1456 [Brucella sp. BO2]|nr:Hypothetical protein BIBO2_1456 [Brucella sp. BO2]